LTFPIATLIEINKGLQGDPSDDPDNGEGEVK